MMKKFLFHHVGTLHKMDIAVKLFFCGFICVNTLWMSGGASTIQSCLVAWNVTVSKL